MQYRSMGIVMAMLIFFSVPAAPVYAADVGPCRAGEHPATADDVKVMKAAGITGAVVGMCWNSKDKIVGQDVGQAKQELEQMWCGGKPATCGSYTSTTSGLDAKFATCAAKFMKELRQVDPRACIRSAYRSTAHQVCACGGNANGIRGKCAPAGRSYHQKGLAIDVNHRNNNAQFWQIAAKSGLYNPAGLHVSDPDHIQAKGGISDCSSGALPPDDQGDYFQDTQRFFPAPANPFANPNTPFMAPPPPPLLRHNSSSASHDINARAIRSCI